MSKHICTRWAFDLSAWTPTLPQLAVAVASVQPEERTRLLKFHFIDDFLSSLVGRLLMRKYVSHMSGIYYHDVKFARDVRGKPYWVLDSVVSKPLTFNVSHHGNMVVLAGVQAAEPEDSSDANDDFGVGVDVMKIEYSGGKSLLEFFRIMYNKFSESEWHFIACPQYSDSEKLKAFMRHWCLKEAYVKELGVGITIDLKKVSFSVDPTLELEINSHPLTSTTLHVNDFPMYNWHFEEHLLQPEYCAAIAFRDCKPKEDTFTFLQIEDLLVRTALAEDDDILEYCRVALRKQRKL